MNRTTLNTLAAAVVLTLAAPASGQEAEADEAGDEADATTAAGVEDAELTAPVPTVETDSRPLSQSEYRAELDSINSESTAATVIYGIGGGIVLVAPLVGFAIPTGPSAGGVAVGGGAGNALLFFIAGAGLSLFVLFPIAIGLDVDSGSRRGALEARRSWGVEITSVSIAPTEAGAVLQLGGRF